MCSQRAAEVIGEANRLQLGSQGLVFVPTQSANRRINQFLYDKYVAGNPAIPAKAREGVALLNALLDNSPIRPVTPVGQLMFNEQKRATENAIFHKLSSQAALDEANRSVQRQLDRALRPARGPLVPWSYFIGVYLAFIALAAGIIYFASENSGCRSSISPINCSTRFPSGSTPFRCRSRSPAPPRGWEW